MKIFDCFMYFDEDLILDVRLNTLDESIDYFVIVESKFNHKGEKRNLKFDLKNFSKFKKKIIYLVYNEIPKEVENIDEIEYLIRNKKAIYDLTIDKRNKKIGDGNKLEKYDLNKLPSYINNNLIKFKKWID